MTDQAEACDVNREYVGEGVSIDKEVGKEMQSVLYDPQTAGGMLICIAADRAAAMLARLRETYTDAAIIGRVSEKSSHSIIVRHSVT